MIVFGTGYLYGVPLTTASGAAVANPTPAQLAVMQEVAGDMSFDEKLLYGQYQFPVAFGRGKGKFSFKAKAANFSGAALGSLFFGLTVSAGIQATADSESHAFATTVTIAPPNSGTYVTDLGAVYASTGIALTRVASGPTVGQYSVNVATGVYTFNVGDTGNVLISYEYTATSTTASKILVSNQLMGYAPTFYAELSLPYNGHQLNIHLNNCLSSKLTLPFKNEDFSIQEFDFMAIADAANNIGTYSIN
jgi:hypothetical protein